MKDRFVFGVFVVVMVLVIGILVGVGYYKSTKDYFVYQGVSSEYSFQKVDMDSMVQYRLMTNIMLNDERVEYNMFFRSSPYDVEGVGLEPLDLRDRLLEGGLKGIYVTQDYSLSLKTEQMSTLGVIEFNRILGMSDYGLYKVPVQSAFTSLEGDMEESKIPVIGCGDGGDGVKVIHVRLGPLNRVYMDGDCVVVEGVDGSGIMLACDKFAYHLLGVF